MIPLWYELHERLSTKLKTTILVLGLFALLSLVFLYLRYLDARTFSEESQAFYGEQIASVYAETLKRTESFYRNRGYANLHSFGILRALRDHDGELLRELSEHRWEVLQSENRHLRSMAFYDASGALLTYLGEESPPHLSPTEALAGFWLDESLRFQVAIPWRGEGYILFILNPRYFLAEIIELTGLEGLILIPHHSAISLPSSLLERRLERALDEKGRPQTHFNDDDSLFLTHRIAQREHAENRPFELLFFQDISASRERLWRGVLESALIIVFLGVVIFVVLNWGFEVLIRRIEELNATLERRVEEEIEKRRANEAMAKEKEQLLIHQSKLASMGEMIGNIAHQWRQPLTQLNTILIAIELFFERGKLSPQWLGEKIREAQGQIDFMSNTVDDFRHFFAPEKQKERFSLDTTISNALNLVQSSLTHHAITYTYTKESEIYIEGYSNEVAQVILNLIANAKDILLERQIPNPYIHITLQKGEGSAIIEVSDNGGGVQITPLERVFEPYVSTKHANLGTGIGLYMSKVIIEKNSQGTLRVKNTPAGACFTITLPTP